MDHENVTHVYDSPAPDTVDECSRLLALSANRLKRYEQQAIDQYEEEKQSLLWLKERFPGNGDIDAMLADIDATIAAELGHAERWGTYYQIELGLEVDEDDASVSIEDKPEEE